MEPGEAPAQAAIREAQEEFGIPPTCMKPLGRVGGLGEEHGEPYVYLCTSYEAMAGKPACLCEEMSAPSWMGLEELEAEAEAGNLFAPFAASLEAYKARGDRGSRGDGGSGNGGASEPMAGSHGAPAFGAADGLQCEPEYGIINIGNKDAGEDVKFRTAKNGNVYAREKTTGEIVGGLGPDIGKSGKAARQATTKPTEQQKRTIAGRSSVKRQKMVQK
jgi:hypothetical protein